MAEIPLQPKNPVEQALQKLCVALSRDCDLDMGHEVRRFITSALWREPFKDTREFLGRLMFAHETAAKLVEAYLTEHAAVEQTTPEDAAAHQANLKRILAEGRPCAKAQHNCDEQWASASDICIRCGFPAHEHKE